MIADAGPRGAFSIDKVGQIEEQKAVSGWRKEEEEGGDGGQRWGVEV